MIFKKYRLYKKLLMGLLITNVFFIMFGIVAGVRYFRDHQWSDGEMMTVGIGILIFGIILPIYLIKKLEVAAKAWEAKIKKTISQWVAAWVGAQSAHEGEEEFYKDPAFWINLTMTTMESLKEDVNHPLFQFVADLAPFIRQSLRKKVTD